MAWATDYSAGTIKLIGLVEILGALGLVLPAATGVATILTLPAATGLAVVMIGAIVVHLRRGEGQMVGINVILLALALFVAWGGLGTYTL